MKICCRCKENKYLSEFNKDKMFCDGLRPFCRDCSKKEWKDRYKKNKEKEKIRKAIFYKNNKDKICLKTAEWRRANRNYGAYKSSKQRAKRMNATPKWLTDIHLKQIQWYYSAAKMMEETSGVRHDVDHIHPLQGKNFSGLNVPWNLRVIRASENRSKAANPPKEESANFWP